MGRKKNKNSNMGVTNISVEPNILPPEHIKLDYAKRLTAPNGQLLNKSALNILEIGRVVRINIHLSRRSILQKKIEYDAPYVEIKDINGKYFMGIILQEGRTMPDYYYPLNSGEYIWFTKEHICQFKEITDSERVLYGTNNYIAYTGYTETFDYISSDSASASDSETDTDYTE